MQADVKKIPSRQFYSNYHGHESQYLHTLLDGIRGIEQKDDSEPRKVIFFIGDSSLDNKYWINAPLQDACNGYENFLDPDKSVPDVCYHLNRLLVDSEYVAVNCAIEESTLGQRAKSRLMEQDRIVKDYLRDGDILIVSVGGNDIALRPTFMTIVNMLALMKLNTEDAIKMGPKKAWGLKYFVDMFRTDMMKYVMNVLGDKKPKIVMLCMIYFPDEWSTGSWADTTLNALNYQQDPTKLQTAIQMVYEYSFKDIEIPGVTVVPCPLFSVLDGKDPDCYVARVEPSSKGGSLMADLFWKLIKENS